MSVEKFLYIPAHLSHNYGKYPDYDRNGCLNDAHNFTVEKNCFLYLFQLHGSMPMISFVYYSEGSRYPCFWRTRKLSNHGLFCIATTAFYSNLGGCFQGLNLRFSSDAIAQTILGLKLLDFFLLKPISLRNMGTLCLLFWKL